MLSQVNSHIGWLMVCQLSQSQEQVIQRAIRLVAVPAFDANAVEFVEFEVFCVVVHNDCSREAAFDQFQIFDMSRLLDVAALPVKPLANHFLPVQSLQNPVRIFFLGCSENDQIVVLGESLYEVVGEWPN